MLHDDNSAAYIKKLVRIIYEKEKQIQQLKKVNRSKHSQKNQQSNCIIDENIQREISMTSTQIKTATLQIAALETKIDNLQSGLLEEETRNAEYQSRIDYLNREINFLRSHCDQLQVEKMNLTVDKSELQNQQRKTKEEIELLKCQNSAKEFKIIQLRKRIEQESQKLSQSILFLNKSTQFFYEISNRIEYSLRKHCPETVRSEMSMAVLEPQHKYQPVLDKYAKLESWMCELEHRMIKINDGREVINETVENLSIIAQEVHELQQCLPTEVNLQLYEEMRQNEQMLLSNLERECKGCELSFNNDLVNMSEVAQYQQKLLMTKQINEQLFDEINQKDQLLSQCKTSITKLFNKHKGGLPDQELKKLGQILQVNGV